MRLILVIGNNGLWAKAATIEEAKRKIGRATHWNAYEVHPDTVVSDHGSLLYPGDHVKDAPKLLKKR